jgi:hypothetical protein
MKLESTYCDATRKLLSHEARARFTRHMRPSSSLGTFSSPEDVITFLEGRAPELAERRSLVVRELLALYQAQATPLAGELLFVAYYPRLRAICREFRDELRSSELEERRAMIVAAFFEAAAKTSLEAQSPTALVLALKTRQLALRALCRANRSRRYEAAWTDRACRVAARTANPESVLVFRETARALDEVLACGLNHSGLHEARATKPTAALERHSGPLSKQLRRANPTASEQEFRRLHQRVRAQRSRARRATRDTSQQSLSQIRGYLDLWDQEGWQ